MFLGVANLLYQNEWSENDHKSWIYKIKKEIQILLTSGTTVIFVSHSAKTDETTLDMCFPTFVIPWSHCLILRYKYKRVTHLLNLRKRMQWDTYSKCLNRSRNETGVAFIFPSARLIALGKNVCTLVSTANNFKSHHLFLWPQRGYPFRLCIKILGKGEGKIILGFFSSRYHIKAVSGLAFLFVVEEL